MEQLTMLGGRFNETVEPYVEGDIVVSKGERFVVQTVVPDDYAYPALVCISLVDGRTAIRFEREVDYRSR